MHINFLRAFIASCFIPVPTPAALAAARALLRHGWRNPDALGKKPSGSTDSFFLTPRKKMLDDIVGLANLTHPARLNRMLPRRWPCPTCFCRRVGWPIRVLCLGAKARRKIPGLETARRLLWWKKRSALDAGHQLTGFLPCYQCGWHLRTCCGYSRSFYLPARTCENARPKIMRNLAAGSGLK